MADRAVSGLNLVSVDVFGRVHAAIQHENGAGRFPRQINGFCQHQDLISGVVHHCTLDRSDGQIGQ
ncbi:MAG TPA: hypothetical protein VI137_04795 [Pseudolabrys sp.]